MKLLLLCILSFFTIHIGFAQVEAEQSGENIPATSIQIKSNNIYGKIVDASTGKLIEAASVQLYPIGKTKTTNLVDGMLSRPNGEFRFQNLPALSKFRLVITALGYKDQEDVITIATENINNSNAFYEKDLGKISMVNNFKKMDEVVVTSSKPAMELGVDRKIFNVEKMILSSGGTGIDILKNIPSVSVDIDGNVELRNSTPQIFIDGRPTILTLDQIPAENIEKIELITNPSAKFDAASAGGIINIVLKKNKRIGLNAVVGLSVGTPKLFGGNTNLNLRQSKFNFFVSAGYNQSGGKAKGRTLRENKSNGITSDYFNQYTINNRNRNNKSIRFGTDFFINNHNSITISQSFVRGNSGSNENQDQEFLDINKTMERYGKRSSDGKYNYKRNSTRLNYKYSFPKQGQELTADISYNNGGQSSNSNIFNNFYYPNGTLYQSPSNVLNNGSSKEKQLTLQADYTNPVSDKIKVEAGIRTYKNNFTSFYNVYARDSGQDIKLPLSNNYHYTENISAAYFTYSYKKESYSYQLGLRAEYSKFSGELIDSAYKFGYKYPEQLKNIWDALFPSLFVTKKISEDDELQFNYSRRIRRPRFWQLNPYIDINDPTNIRQGNPQLRPEYVNSFELNYSHNYKKANLLAVLYYRNNPRDITQYSDTITAAQYQQLNNAAIEPNAILNTFINANTTNSYGAEFTLQYKVGENFEITPTVNLQYRTVSAKVSSINLTNKGFNWQSKLMSSYKIQNNKKPIFNNLSFQFIADYESPRVIPQGKRLAEFDVDLAIKKEFLKNKKASITFAVNDVFNSNRWGAIYDTEQFYQDAYRRWNVRNFRLSFSYKFGDAKFSLIKGNSRRGDNDD
ncbi:MAG TPA: TonB-dependent receptor [Ferruginibacter sp.]|nr:TonB-dependent receptor [Ferruginibacter sp.]